MSATQPPGDWVQVQTWWQRQKTKGSLDLLPERYTQRPDWRNGCSHTHTFTRDGVVRCSWCMGVQPPMADVIEFSRKEPA